ncbi:unnamed protein product [Soboliphyme baturini]|uniref:proline--tRNA ligase n=1 Tax=Soboliphyme baturini TaxID=241478 RepID=A0A183IPF1_9BILA|nr:unnamed protein product [Soboliphyme baturini]
MIEYYDVSGCYVIRPWAFAIWDVIYKWFDAKITELGVTNCYFPLFVSKAALEKEKTHIEDFSPEVAWVTRSGRSELAEPIALRPTSETVIYPSFARWIQSYRDLPLKVNQWCNIVRWEFKHPTPFIRTREILWQEGHTAFASREEAVIEAATSHHLGQNFSKMFEIMFENPITKEKENVYQNSWGLTTRTIGILTMIHSDNRGLVLPPKVAKIQVVVIPCGITSSLKKEKADEIHDVCVKVNEQLVKADIRSFCDLRENCSPGWKFNHWELKGVPLRIEIGPRDLGQKQVTVVRRDTSTRQVVPQGDLVDNIAHMAMKQLSEHRVTVHDWDEFLAKLEAKCIILAPFCDDSGCEERIKRDSTREEPSEPGAPAMGAKTLCIPFEQPQIPSVGCKCIYPHCTRSAVHYALFGRSY